MKLIKLKNHLTEDIEVNLMLYALKERYGYDFSGYARASLKRRLNALCKYFAVNQLSDLLAGMLYDEALATTIINSITVPTSNFFRDPLVWRQVREKVFPQLASFPWINIWQVGCGHGEETYTLAIMLHEAGLLKKARIYTSDINPAFLQETQNGSWPRHRMQRWRENYLQAGGNTQFDNYFEDRGERIAIRDDLKQSIHYVQHNLVDDNVFKEAQFVVCRNVLIYFGDSLLEQVLQLFLRSLERGGFLMLGHSEKIMELRKKFPNLELFSDEAQLYRKVIMKVNHV